MTKTQYAILETHAPHPKGERPSAFCDEGRGPLILSWHRFDTREEADGYIAYLEGDWTEAMRKYAREEDLHRSNAAHLKVSCVELTSWRVIRREVTEWEDA